MLPLLLTIREPARREAGKIAGRVHGLGEGLRYIAAHRGAYGVQIGAVVIAATMGYAGTAWAVSIFVRAHGLSTPQAGALVGTVALFAGPIGNLAGGWFADRVIARNVVGPTPFVIGISIAGALLPAYLFCLSPSLALAVIGYAIFQFFSVFTLPASYCGTQLLTPERYRGIAASVSLLCYTVFAMGVGPPSVGFLTDHLFRNAQALPYALLLVLTLLACVGVPVAFLGRKRFQRDMLI
jgi:MFS family permease